MSAFGFGFTQRQGFLANQLQHVTLERAELRCGQDFVLPRSLELDCNIGEDPARSPTHHDDAIAHEHGFIDPAKWTSTRMFPSLLVLSAAAAARIHRAGATPSVTKLAAPNC